MPRLTAKPASWASEVPLHALSLVQASELIQQRKITPSQLVRVFIDRVERLNPKTNAFVTTTLESASQAAHRLSKELDQGHCRGPLHGIPIAHKDVFLTQGVRTTAHSRQLRDWTPQVVPSW